MLMHDGVSAWRTYFVANEWLKLATKRRTSMRVQIVSVIGVFWVNSILCYKYFTFTFKISLQIISGDCAPDQSPHHILQDPTMRIAISFLLYLTVYLVQRIIFAALLERYFNNTVQRFVDICSLANVSLFVLELESFGYYVHGRYNTFFIIHVNQVLVR